MSLKIHRKFEIDSVIFSLSREITNYSWYHMLILLLFWLIWDPTWLGYSLFVLHPVRLSELIVHCHIIAHNCATDTTDKNTQTQRTQIHGQNFKPNMNTMPQICVYVEMEFLNLVRVKFSTFLYDLLLLLLRFVPFSLSLALLLFLFCYCWYCWCLGCACARVSFHSLFLAVFLHLKKPAASAFLPDNTFFSIENITHTQSIQLFDNYSFRGEGKNHRIILNNRIVYDRFDNLLIYWMSLSGRMRFVQSRFAQIQCC